MLVQAGGPYARPLGRQTRRQVGEAHLVGEGDTRRDHDRRV
ncbi:hypothetical protein [Streptomyces fuscichromogenes]